MSRARILADYVSSGDELALKAPLISPALVTPNLGTPSAGVLTNVTGLVATTGLTASGTKSSGTFLRGDNTWDAAGGATSGMISNVWRTTDTGGNLSINTSTETVATDARAFSATSGRHYVISGMQHCSPYRTAGTHDNRLQYNLLYYGTADKALNDTGSLGTRLFGAYIGRYLIGTSAVNATFYALFSYNAWFTAGSTAPHYVYTVGYTDGSNNQGRWYNDADQPHHTIIYEVMP